LVSVVGGAAPQAAASVTSPVRSGGNAVLTARGCGRSANGEVRPRSGSSATRPASASTARPGRTAPSSRGSRCRAGPLPGPTRCR
jgi:hypothetical protein